MVLTIRELARLAWRKIVFGNRRCGWENTLKWEIAFYSDDLTARVGKLASAFRRRAIQGRSVDWHHWGRLAWKERRRSTHGTPRIESLCRIAIRPMATAV